MFLEVEEMLYLYIKQIFFAILQINLNLNSNNHFEINQ